MVWQGGAGRGLAGVLSLVKAWLCKASYGMVRLDRLWQVSLGVLRKGIVRRDAAWQAWIVWLRKGLSGLGWAGAAC